MPQLYRDRTSLNLLTMYLLIVPEIISRNCYKTLLPCVGQRFLKTTDKKGTNIIICETFMDKTLSSRFVNGIQLFFKCCFINDFFLKGQEYSIHSLFHLSFNLFIQLFIDLVIITFIETLLWTMDCCRCCGYYYKQDTYDLSDHMLTLERNTEK